MCSFFLLFPLINLCSLSIIVYCSKSWVGLTDDWHATILCPQLLSSIRNTLMSLESSKKASVKSSFSAEEEEKEKEEEEEKRETETESEIEAFVIWLLPLG